MHSLDTILNIAIKIRLYHQPKIGCLPLRAA
nr:MAG TPA: hypothetical protein [Caudoviricetes sp.]